jgi:hypothetical protein
MRGLSGAETQAYEIYINCRGSPSTDDKGTPVTARFENSHSIALASFKAQ